MTREGKTPIPSTTQFKTCRKGCFAGCGFGKRKIVLDLCWKAVVGRERSARCRGGVAVGRGDFGRAEWGRSWRALATMIGRGFPELYRNFLVECGDSEMQFGDDAKPDSVL